MEGMGLAIVYGAGVSLLHFSSDYLSLRLSRYRERLLSFGAGISITYLFMELLPLIHEGGLKLRTWSHISILVGFTLFHLIEKHIYQHTKREEIFHRLMHVHSLGFFVYFLILGIVLSYLTSQSPMTGTLFLIPVLFHSSISSASSKEIHENIKENNSWRMFLSSSSLLGVLIFYLPHFPQSFIFIALGFVVGVIFYIIIKDILPEQAEGDPKYFVLGIFLFLILILGLKRIMV